MQVVPLHVDALADRAGWRAVVRRFDFDTAIEMDGPLAVPVVAKWLARQRPERRLLSANSANVAATCRFVVPWIRVSPSAFPIDPDTLAPPPASRSGTAERRLLRVTDARFDLDRSKTHCAWAHVRFRTVPRSPVSYYRVGEWLEGTLGARLILQPGQKTNRSRASHAHWSRTWSRRRRDGSLNRRMPASLDKLFGVVLQVATGTRNS